MRTEQFTDHDRFRLLNPQEVADILGCDRSTAQHLMATQAIKSRNIAVAGKRLQLRTTFAQIEAYISTGEESASGGGIL